MKEAMICDGDMLFVADISANISETPEGFIVCHDVPIAKAGQMVYGPGELRGKDGKPLVTPGHDGLTVIETTPESLRDPVTIASFEGKSLTLGHPNGFVTPDNFQRVTIGEVRNVRNGKISDRGTVCDALISDIVVKERRAIDSVRSKRLRQVSSGYAGKYTEVRPGYGTCDFRIGNHVALVQAGRAGESVAIHDSAKQQEQEQTMSQHNPTSLATRIARFLGLGLTADAAVANAVAEETAAAQAAAAQPAGIAAALDAALAPLTARLAALEQKGTVPATQAQPTQDAAIASLRTDMGTLTAAVSGLVQKLGQANTQCTDQETIARAEILAPGCAKTADCRTVSLATCYATQDGKSVIDGLLGGKTFDATDNVLFVAASEVMKAKRAGALAAAADAARSQQGGGQQRKALTSPEDVNKANAEFWAKNGGTHDSFRPTH